MFLKLDKRNKPFREMKKRYTSADAQRRMFATVGIIVAKDARRGANREIGGNFGAKIADSVTHNTKANGVVVGAKHFASSHKQFGGTISAPGKGEGSTGAKMLSIPIDSKSYGKNPSDFADLFMFKTATRAFLAQKLDGGGILPLFVLVKSVKQKGVKWFPEGSRAENLVDKAIRKWTRAQNIKG